MSANPHASIEDIVHVVTAMQESVKVLFSKERLQIFVKATFVQGNLDALLKHANVLILLTESDPLMEHYLIAVMEDLCTNDPKMFTFALLQLYEAEVIQEEIILEWSSEIVSGDRRVSKEAHDALRGSAKPLISWLREDCSEDED